MTDQTQDQKDARVEAAFKAWEARDPETQSKEDIKALWEGMWEACDFSWEGLADAGWDQDGRLNTAQIYKQWYAHESIDLEDFGIDPVFPEASLQDYWRWSLGVHGYEGQHILLTDEQLLEAGLLTHVEGKLWHVAHRPESSCNGNPALADLILARASQAPGYKDQWNDGRLLLNGSRAMGVMRKLFQWQRTTRNEPDGSQPLHIAANLAEFRRVYIPGTIFGPQADFGSSYFGGNAFCNNIIFQGNAHFALAQFGGNAFFHQAQFEKRAFFAEAQFGGEAHFAQASFAGNTAFSDAKFTGEAYFDDATFTDEAYFLGAAFAARADFSSAKFKSGAYFDSAAFDDMVGFDSATFASKADFSSAKFKDSADFNSVHFKQTAMFENTKWGWDEATKKWLPVHYGRAFYSARFHETANFETDHFTAFAAFDGAVFDRKLGLRLPSKSKDPKAHFKHASKAAVAKVKDRESTDSAKTQFWGELSSGYKTAKVIMERDGDFNRAQLYHRYEIEARLKLPTTRAAEKGAAWVYGWVSDYGASLKRPPFALFCLFLLSTAFYLFLANCNGTLELAPPRLDQPFASDFVDAISLSFKNTFLNLDSFGGSAVTTAETSERLFGKGSLVGGAARLFGVVQTTLSLILVFLFALAIKRKFQIK